MRAGYDLCMKENQVTFIREAWFKEQFEMLLAGCGKSVMLLCDDNVFYRRVVYPWFPVLEGVLCFHYRLGKNTTYCYPLDQQQEFPETIRYGVFHYWMWDNGQHDFGYPASIDGSVWRPLQLLEMIRAVVYYNPNTLEDVMVQKTRMYLLPAISCHEESHVVGLPLNRVNTTHPNRHEYSESVDEMNKRYLAGERISLKTIDPKKVNGAHTPFELKWEHK